MSQDFALPSSSSLERDARQIAHTQAKLGDIALGVIVGRTSEFFDFFVYAIASALVFPRLFFPMVDPLTATLYSFSVFALAFVARPIGSVVFMAIDRRHGRGTRLTIALFLLGGSTAAISFLPGYAEIGSRAIWSLSICRIGQGLALAGSWDGMRSLLALNTPEARRGRFAMIPQLGAPLGFLLAAGLFAYFVGNLSPEDFLDWGWRYPFFAAFAVNVVALFARLRLVETEEFGTLFERRELSPVPVLALLKTDWRNVVIGAVAPLASFAMFHLVTVFPLSWVTLFTKQHTVSFLRVEMVGAVIALLSIIASGFIADLLSRRRLLAICAALIAIFSLFAPELLGGGPIKEAIYLLLGFGLLGLSFGQAAGSVSSNFSSQNRYTGAAVTSDLAWLVGAGFAPLVALGLSSRFGLAAAGAYLLFAALGTLAALVINRQLKADYEP